MRPSQVCSTAFRRKDSTLPPEGGTTNARRLRGDLDNIILKAMRKEQALRYDSVEQLSQDIARHLAGEPVIAQKPTVAYRADKYIRRNKAWVAFAAFVAFVLIGMTASSIRQWQVAIRRCRQAQNDHTGRGDLHI